MIKSRQSVIVYERGLVLKEGLKTQRKRDFSIMVEVQAILKDLKPESFDLEGFLFRSPREKFIDQQDLRRERIGQNKTVLKLVVRHDNYGG